MMDPNGLIETIVIASICGAMIGIVIGTLVGSIR